MILQKPTKETIEEIIKEFSCGCEVCAHSASICPAVASSYVEEIACLRRNREAKMQQSELMAVSEESQTITPDELAKDLRVGRHTVYEGLRSGKIPAIRLGKRFVIPRAAIQEWLKTAGQLAILHLEGRSLR